MDIKVNNDNVTVENWSELPQAYFLDGFEYKIVNQLNDDFYAVVDMQEFSSGKYPMNLKLVPTEFSKFRTRV